MTLIACASLSGSPGVTTTALAIAACWPVGAEPVLAEADPCGGDVQAWFGLPDAPGMVSLAAASRRGSGPDLLAGHAVQLPGGLLAVPGPAGAGQAHAAARQLAATGYEPVTAAAAGQVIIADCGRLIPATPVTALLRAADLVLILTAADAAALAHVHAWLETSSDLADQPELLLSGRGWPYPAREIAGTLGVRVAGRLPWDPVGAGVLHGVPVRRGPRTRWRPPARLPLLAAAGQIAARAARALQPVPDNEGAAQAPGQQAGPAVPAEAPALASADARASGGGRKW